MAGEAAGADQLDLEAAEQLIQLSGGDGEYGGSESRSWDSVTCRSADQAGGVKEKEVAVESRRRSVGRRFVAGKDGNGGVAAGEPDRRKSADDSVDNKRFSSRAAAGTEEEKGKEEEEPAVESRRRGAGVVDGDGEDRRRPRFRWLADIYTETTRQLIMTRDLRVVVGDDDPPEAEQRRRKRERAADAGDVRGGGRPRAVQGKQGESNGGIGIIGST